MERPKNKKQFTPDQQGVKRYLNENYGRALFNSIHPPVTVTEQYLGEFREALAKPDVFDAIGYRKFREIGPINHKNFLRCLEALEHDRPLRSTMLDKVVDYVIDRPSLKFEMLAAEVVHDHLVNVEWALNEMQEKPLNRDLSWLCNPKVSDETSLMFDREVDKHAMDELDRLKYRYYIPSVSPGVDAERLIKNELTIFNRLLEPGHMDDTWQKIEDYPRDLLYGKVDMHELYIAGQDLEKGKLLDALRSYHSGRRRLMAKAQAVKLYIKFLEDELAAEPEQRVIVEPKSNQDPNLKFPLRIKQGVDTKDLKGKLEALYFALRNSGKDPFVECTADVFVDVFLPNVLPSGHIKWMQDNKSLGYFFWKLRGMDFIDKSDNDSNVTYENPNASVFIDLIADEGEFKKRIENCFIRKEGRKVTGNSVISPKTKRQLDKDLRLRLDAALAPFIQS